MQKLQLAGVELYFEDLPRARAFYKDVLGLEIADEAPAQYAKFDGGASFICVERKGSESYPSQDKAVLFFEVEDLVAALESLGPERIVQSGRSQTGPPTWAVIHDPEGHNILLLQKD
jgi:predicted enzyme related to lactoylglutathione lyase